MNRLHCALAFTLFAAAGCGGGAEFGSDRPATVDAEGVVTLNGEGVEGATVVLAPEFSGANAYTASAVSTSGGAFTLMAFPPDEGVVPGDYRVGVTKMESTGPTEPSASHEEAPPATSKNLLPEKFADPNASGLKVTIPAGGTTDLKIELK